MEFAPGTQMHGFTVATCEDLPEIDGTAVTFTHGASGARLLYLRNADANKAFAIGFRTPPKDDTGVFHILEHSVLCGSRRFPVKEPFVNLLKGSMQTFLNAMTFSDKTLYPVASTNEQDLYNLMDVYLDAVFHPAIYEKRQVFEQEGWHYELEGADGGPGCGPGEGGAGGEGANEGALVYNGVVFNEMKGALSDANSVLYDRLQAQLFPDTCYVHESGGTPEGIPALTYEEYLDEHRRHYRTDNSYITLYGNLDIDRALAFLDERYLAPVAAEQRAADEQRAAAGAEPLRPRAITFQEPVRNTERRLMKTAPENACSACGYVIGGSGDCLRFTAVEILLDALLGSNEAPLKRALLDAGVAHDVQAFVSEAVLQPFAVVQLQLPDPELGAGLADVLAREVRALLDAGLDRMLVEAALSHAEFQMREHEFGMADGVVYAMAALSGWLYDDAAATEYLRYEHVFAELRELLQQGYFEELAEQLFCQNPHAAFVEVVPVPDMPDVLAARLEREQAQLTAQDRARIAAEVELLREIQEAPDTPEALATLPRLGVADIGEAPEDAPYGFQDGAPVPCLRHRLSTHGIAYAYRYFDATHLAFGDLPYLSVLCMVLGKLGTARHTAAELDTLAQGKLGNLSFYANVYGAEGSLDEFCVKVVASASALSENVAWLAQLPREAMLETDFSDTARILDILQQRKIGMEQMFCNNGHSCAASRVRSYYARAAVVQEQLGNVDFHRFLCDLIDHYDERAAELAERLADVASRVFCDDVCQVSFAGADADLQAFWDAGATCGRVLGAGAPERMEVPAPQVRNEAFAVPSDVCFAATGWDRRAMEGAPDTGLWNVASRVLTYDYLWNEVRVKGGAYGVGFVTSRFGNMRFHSYRDPHLDETLARFAQAGAWLASFDPAPEDFEGFIVATVAGMDAPHKPREVLRRQAGDFFSGIPQEDRLERRAHVLAATPEALRALGATVADVPAHGARCVFGNKDILAASTAGWDVVELFG